MGISNFKPPLNGLFAGIKIIIDYYLFISLLCFYFCSFPRRKEIAYSSEFQSWAIPRHCTEEPGLTDTLTNTDWDPILHSVTLGILFRTTHWTHGSFAILRWHRVQSLSLKMKPAHSGVTTDYRLLHERFMIDIKFDSYLWHFLAEILFTLQLYILNRS